MRQFFRLAVCLIAGHRQPEPSNVTPFPVTGMHGVILSGREEEPRCTRCGRKIRAGDLSVS